MALSRRRGSNGEGLNAWPGYVDALSTLLMVIIFVLLVFVLAQAFLSVALSGKDKSLDRLHRQIARISDMLSLEQSHTSDLKTALAQATRDLRTASQENDTLQLRVANLQSSMDHAVAAQNATAAERDRLRAQLSDAQAQASAAEERNQALQTQVTSLGASLQSSKDAIAAREADLAKLNQQLQLDASAREKLANQLAETTSKQEQAEARNQALSQRQRQLSAAVTAANEAISARETAIDTFAQRLQSATAKGDQLASQLAETQAKQAQSEAQNRQLQAQIADLNANVRADKETVEARVADLVKLNEQLKALAALRDQLEQKAENAAARATTEQQRREAMATQLAEERDLGESARAQILLLNQQIQQLRDQLQAVQSALDTTTTAAKEKELKIADLGNRLNVALASKVEELKQYRSEFFGRLRQLLAGEQGIQIVGDRFVFQSEVLFPLNSADLTVAGKDQIDGLAATLLQIAQKIPPDLPWVLRVDGHADKQPITGGAFASNWELSAQRAINVVKLLIADGIPANHVAATAFGDEQPLVNGDTPEDYAKNRRIEFRLTDR